MHIDEKIKDALLEDIFIMRWKKDRTSQYALLNTIELKETIDNIFKELDDAGYKIVKKTRTKSKRLKNGKKQEIKRSLSNHRPVKEFV